MLEPSLEWNRVLGVQEVARHTSMGCKVIVENQEMRTDIEVFEESSNWILLGVR